MDQGLRVNIKLMHMKVSSFSPLDKTVVLQIDFEDTAPKQIYRLTRIDSPAKTAAVILNELSEMEENIHMEFDGRVLVGNAYPVIESRAEMQTKLQSFLEKLKQLSEQIKHAKSAEGYTDLLRKVSKLEIDF